MRLFSSVSALLLSLTLSVAYAGDHEKVEVTSLPDAVKATIAKEAPGATMAMKTGKDGKTMYHVKTKDADGKPIILIVGEDGAVISKNAPKKDGDKHEKDGEKK
jgi:hypothetical protein